jgi:hypothetical protein
MLLGEYSCWRHIGDRRAQLIFPSSYNVPFTMHYGVEAGLGHVHRIIFFLLSDFLGATLREFVTNAGRCAGDKSKRTSRRVKVVIAKSLKPG